VPPVDVSPRLVAAAVAGDQPALEQVLRAVVDDVRRLAQRMLWHPQDAEDATQEILVKVATRLSTFRGDARVTTWVHRIAINHLLTTRRRRAEDPSLTFAAFGEDLALDLDAVTTAAGSTTTSWPRR
jgi:DNA-directed RNA polymerase specialized sigma24 family protein